ncbi:MAG: NAD(P)/FAD-dependent oxidoreductase [Oscillospiraceae bacterium]|nr:NAD(P)/FAD-dependent oxidoreductase [Oscillospiraceae bacterium]
MKENTEIAIVGGGPAGLSAALNARVKNKSTRLLGSDYRESNLYKAERLDNILGIPSLTGQAYLEHCMEQLAGWDVDFIAGRVLSVMPMGDKFMISCGTDIYTADAVILASGIVQTASFPGEADLLGKGVSYCAACDGMLYRGKRVAVVIRSGDGAHEANYLHEIGCEATVVSDGRDLSDLDAAIPVVQGRKIAVLGEGRVEGLQVGDTVIPCEGVFILRATVALGSLLPNLEVAEGHINVDRDMQTSIPGVFAAGDCTGRPYQVSKAAGEGQVAAFAAAAYIDKLQKR